MTITWQFQHKNGRLYTIAAMDARGLKRHRDAGHVAVNMGSGWLDIQDAIDQLERNPRAVAVQLAVAN